MMSTANWQHFASERLPRYTSYPTAPHFNAAVSASSYRDWLAGLPADRPVSLYLHIPFCRSMCWYCGCHTTVARRDGPVERYVEALRREIAEVGRITNGALVADHVHFGGGTPTILAPESFAELRSHLGRAFKIGEHTEIAIEIDPRTLTGEMADTLAQSGVTRASIGVQTFDRAVQLAINRIQSVEQTVDAVKALRQAGISAINFDLIYGLPGQTVGSCLETIDQCLALEPNRLSVFGYAHVPSFKRHQRKIRQADLPDTAARQQQAEAMAARLVEAGYDRIGLDHFARPDDPMTAAQRNGTLHRNFQGYTTDRCETLLGLGASAIGRLPQGFVQNQGVIADYCRRVQQQGLATARGYRFQGDDIVRAELIERLMCDYQVDVSRICARHGVASDIVSDVWPRLRHLASQNLVVIEGQTIRIPQEARLLVRLVAAAFDAYLGTSARTYSVAV